jgi:hypothetical protein
MQVSVLENRLIVCRFNTKFNFVSTSYYSETPTISKSMNTRSERLKLVHADRRTHMKKLIIPLLQFLVVNALKYLFVAFLVKKYEYVDEWNKYKAKKSGQIKK